MPAFVSTVAVPDSRHHRGQIRQNACRTPVFCASSPALKFPFAETGKCVTVPPLLGIRAAGASA